MHPYHRSPLVDPCLGLLPDFVFRPTREVQAPKIQAADKPFLDLSAIGRVMLTGSHSWMYNVQLRIHQQIVESLIRPDDQSTFFTRTCNPL